MHDVFNLKQWEAMGFSWRLDRHRSMDWLYLVKNNKIVAEGPGRDKKRLLELGWYN